MGVLIVAGVTVIVVTLVHAHDGAAARPRRSARRWTSRRARGSPAYRPHPDRLAVQLQGGGPDRVVVMDLRTGRIVAGRRWRGERGGGLMRAGVGPRRRAASRPVRLEAQDTALSRR